MTRARRNAWDVDEAAVMYVFQSRAAVHLTEETVVSAAFAMPKNSRAALRRLVERGELLREGDESPVYRRPQDTLRGLLSAYAMRALLVVAVAVLVAWVLRLVGVFDGSLWEPVVTLSIVGLTPAALPVWRERRHRRG